MRPKSSADANINASGIVVVNLNEYLVDIMPLVRREVGESTFISTSLTANLWPVRVSAGDIQHAVLKTLGGLQNAMPRAERLIIETRNLRSNDEARGHGFPPGEYVHLFIWYGVFAASPMADPVKPLVDFEAVEHGFFAVLGGLARQIGGHQYVRSPWALHVCELLSEKSGKLLRSASPSYGATIRVRTARQSG